MKNKAVSFRKLVLQSLPEIWLFQLIVVMFLIAAQDLLDHVSRWLLNTCFTALTRQVLTYRILCSFFLVSGSLLHYAVQLLSLLYLIMGFVRMYYEFRDGEGIKKEYIPMNKKKRCGC